MGRYIIRRLIWMIPIILGVAVLVFTLMLFCPGDPATLILGQGAVESDLILMREKLGLTDPYFVRLARFLSDVFLHFDFGKSWVTGAEIKLEIMDKLPRTMMLSLISLTISILLGIPLGIIAAVNQGKWQDNLCMTIALIGVSVPGFWIALLLIIAFAVKLQWLPPMGIGSWKHYILPALSCCWSGIATLARLTRSSMLDVVRADYITTARAKGVSEFRVVTKHALSNSLIPIITTIGTFFGRMLGGSIVTESIFAIPGMGLYIIGAVNARDYPVVQAGSILLAASFSFCMLMVDLVYAAVDPRIKAQYARTKKKGK